MRNGCYLSSIYHHHLLVGGKEGGLVDIHGEGDNGPPVLSIRLRRQSLLKNDILKGQFLKRTFFKGTMQNYFKIKMLPGRAGGCSLPDLPRGTFLTAHGLSRSAVVQGRGFIKKTLTMLLIIFSTN